MVGKVPPEKSESMRTDMLNDENLNGLISPSERSLRSQYWMCQCFWPNIASFHYSLKSNSMNYGLAKRRQDHDMLSVTKAGGTRNFSTYD